MVIVAQLVRALDCGSRGRRFKPGPSPLRMQYLVYQDAAFVFIIRFYIAKLIIFIMMPIDASLCLFKHQYLI